MLFGQDIKSAIIKSASLCDNVCYIATAYCKTSAFQELFVNSSSHAKVKILLLRWELDDLVSGVSDLDVYALAKQHGWSVYLNQKLHAKVYRFDNECYIGSANLTQKGITGSSVSLNLEAVSNESVNNEIESWFLQLINSSRELDDELYLHIANDVEKYAQIDVTVSEIDYSIETQNLLNKQKVDALYTTDFLWLANPQQILEEHVSEIRNLEHDLMLLRLRAPISENDISIAFHQSKAFHWLLNILLEKNEIYFGELTNHLHDVLQDDPAPYRKSVKILLNNLINWARNLSESIFEIDSPNISTRIKLRN